MPLTAGMRGVGPGARWPWKQRLETPGWTRMPGPQPKPGQEGLLREGQLALACLRPLYVITQPTAFCVENRALGCKTHVEGSACQASWVPGLAGLMLRAVSGRLG